RGILFHAPGAVLADVFQVSLLRVAIIAHPPEARSNLIFGVLLPSSPFKVPGEGAIYVDSSPVVLKLEVDAADLIPRVRLECPIRRCPFIQREGLFELP